VSVTLRVNPIACVGHGMCAELLPELIQLDPWGYPILASPTVPRPLADHARRAGAQDTEMVTEFTVASKVACAVAAGPLVTRPTS